MTRRSATATCVAALLAMTAPALPTTSQKPLDGLYCGTAWSGGRLVEVRTKLRTEGNGLLSGTYDFADFDETTSGTLAEREKTSETTRTLTWVDIYGTGPVVMVFDEAGRSFTGLWNADSAKPAYQWDGERCEDATV